MKPVDQLILHDPDNGVYGDCQRACIASLLEMDPNDVPHFNERFDCDHFDRVLNRFLGKLGYFHLMSGTFSFDHQKKLGAVDCYHLIYGMTERATYHAVVGLNGEIVHDPHPSRAGLLESDRENWCFAFLVKADQAFAGYDARRREKLVEWFEREADEAEEQAEAWVDGCDERLAELLKASNCRAAAAIIKATS